MLNSAVILNGNDGNDALFGSQFNDTLNGGDDDDTIEGGDGNDTITGGLGSDSLSGGAGNDIIVNYDNTDTFLDGGSGVDTLRVDPRSGDVVIDLTAQSIERIEVSRSNGIPSFEGRGNDIYCLLYTSPSPRDLSTSRMPSSA